MTLTNMSKKTIDIVIPYHNKDSDIIEMCVNGCINNVRNLGNIYVVTNDINLSLDRVQIIDENKLFGNELSKKQIELMLREKQPSLLHRHGWLFQQFIKMGCSYAIPNLTNFYLVVDSDVVFLKKINFFDNKRMLLAKTSEYYQPHFNCCERLLGEPVNQNNIFVAHHMLICKSIMLELLHNIENRFGQKWHEAILDNINSDTEHGSMLSEYELYGHYLENNHPEKMSVRKLRYVQSFKMRLLLPILFNQAYYVAIHNYKKPENNPKTNSLKYNLFLNLVKRRLEKTSQNRF